MAEKVTAMVLKGNLQCRFCHNKINKILGKFPEIRNKVYNVEANTVTFNVVNGDPVEVQCKLLREGRCKLLRKGRKLIDSVEIKPPEEKKADKAVPQPACISAPGCPMMPWCWKCYQVYGAGNALPPACSCGCGGYGYCHGNAHRGGFCHYNEESSQCYCSIM